MSNRYYATTMTVGVLALGFAFSAMPLAHAQSAAQKPRAQSTAVQERTVTLTIDNMTCGLCPVTVKKAISGVAGVRAVEIDFAAKTATVSFDPARASVAAIAAASTNAGYPAKPAS